MIDPDLCYQRECRYLENGYSGYYCRKASLHLEVRAFKCPLKGAIKFKLDDILGDTQLGMLQKENKKLKKQIHDLTHCVCGLEKTLGYCERCDFDDHDVVECIDCGAVMHCPQCDRRP
jgi:hypothetical protein